MTTESINKKICSFYKGTLKEKAIVFALTCTGSNPN